MPLGSISKLTHNLSLGRPFQWISLIDSKSADYIFGLLRRPDAADALGVAAAFVTIRVLTKLIPTGMMEGMPYLSQLGITHRVLMFAAIISLLAIVFFSIVPSMRLSRADLRGDLADGGRASAGIFWRSLGTKLVILELTTAMVLLASAGLFGKSLYRLLNVDIGYQPDHLASLLVTMPNSYQKNEQVMALERSLTSQIGGLPGVKSVGISTVLPSNNWGMATTILVPGRAQRGEHDTVSERDVSSDYLKTLGARLVRGRYFSEFEDDPSKAHVGVINESFAREYFPKQDPIGKRIFYEVRMSRLRLSV